MPIQDLAALIVAAVAVVGVGFNFWQARGQDERLRKLEAQRSLLAREEAVVNAKLAREEAVAKAKLDYEYEGRKRLYERFEPLRFQLLDLTEFALEQIRSLTDAAIWKEFVPVEDDADRAAKEHRTVMAKGTYPLTSTLYGLLAPLVIVRSMGRELTFTDLALDTRMAFQYYLATRAYGAWKDDGPLAKANPRIPYEPFADNWRVLRESQPATYWWQGLTMGRLEMALDVLTITSQGQPDRLASYGEFEQAYEAARLADSVRDRKTLAAAANPLLNFRPSDRPVFWRMLIAQACLYDAILKARSDAFETPTTKSQWDRLLTLRQPHAFDWRGDASGAPDIDETLGAVRSYLDERVITPHLAGLGPHDEASIGATG